MVSVGTEVLRFKLFFICGKNHPVDGLDAESRKKRQKRSHLIFSPLLSQGLSVQSHALISGSVQ